MTTSGNAAETYRGEELLATGLFLEDWYMETYPAVRQSGLAPADHFARIGARQGLRPNPWFDADYYGAQSGIADPVKALLHYAQKGWRRRFDPSADFLLVPYLLRNGDVAEADIEPLAHFIAYGRAEGRTPVSLEAVTNEGDPVRAVAARVKICPLFDATFYVTEHAHLIGPEDFADPALHYARAGETANLKPNPYFDPHYYAAQLAAAPANLLLHYHGEGWQQGLNPSAGFNTRLYEQVYAGMGLNGRDPLEHFLTVGRGRGFAPVGEKLAAADPDGKVRKAMADVVATGLFDPVWYLEANADLAQHRINPLEHYVRYGAAEGRWPNALFDPTGYRNRYRDQIGDEDPLVYYAREGFRRLHDPSARFSAKLYFQLNPDLVPGHTDALKHFLTVGEKEGRIEPDTGKFGSDALHYLALPTGEQLALRKQVAETGLFSTDWYRTEYGGRIKGGLEPIEHYLIFGRMAGLKPNPWFDPVWYAGRYRREIGDRLPILYYADTGWKEGHWPSATFDPEAYRGANPDIRDFPGSPLSHYLCYGIGEGRRLPLVSEFAGSGSAFYIAGGKTLIDPAMQGMIDFERRPLCPTAHDIDLKALDIHWVIPDFAAGGGGHMTIFRMVSHLERQGHKVTLWLHNPNQHKNPDDARETINKHFQHVRAEVRFLDTTFAEKAKGDALIATDCWTVWPVLAAADFVERFYFVQDFEPQFHPMGGKYLAAEQTYRQDLFCLCASPWLAGMLERDFGRRTAHFWLAADQKLYRPLIGKQPNRLPRIAFYSRIKTDRRAVELGLLALELLARRGVAFHVDLFGGDTELKLAPFPFTDHGVASPSDLATLFGQADIGVVFSATNYSLVPQEMMACGLPIVELDGESTRAVYPADAVTWAEPDPVTIADAIEALIADTERQKRQAEAALEWVGGFSWDKAARTVEGAIVDAVRRRSEAGPGAGKLVAHSGDDTVHASVVIPTYNAGPQFEAVLEAVCSQHTPWRYEVLAIDSGSTDGTLALIEKFREKFPGVRLHRIDKADFSHGGTRNLGVELTTGDYIAFLTHDARPANSAWLFNLVSALEDAPKAAGAFGRHLAYPDASAFTKRDLDAHFDTMLRYPLSLSAKTDSRLYEAGDEGWRQVLHFYSDNNSCLRRSVWQQIPYRPIAFGEDQVWADDIIAAGYEKIYAVQAVVYHSHDYDETETRERAAIESSFFRHFFGYDLVTSEAERDEKTGNLNAADRAWGEAHGLDEADIAFRLRLNAARMQGYLDGWQADTAALFGEAAS